MSVSSSGERRAVGNVGISRSCGMGHLPDTWIERARAIAPRHLGQWDDLDLRSVACSAELFEALAAKVAQRVHRGFQELARIEFAFALRCDLAERGGHRQPAIGI